MTKHYSGIGARQTPDEALGVLTNIGRVLANKGFVLRSGGAEGADDAFEKGCIAASGEMEIYLPWSTFNNRSPKNLGYIYSRESNYEGYSKAKVIAAQYHPVWNSLNDAAKMMHTRNVHQVLGINCETPSEFLVCWCVQTSPTEFQGGTGQALRIAKAYNVPVYNLYVDDDVTSFSELLKTI